MQRLVKSMILSSSSSIAEMFSSPSRSWISTSFGDMIWMQIVTHSEPDVRSN